MTAFDTRHNHQTYDRDTHKVVPKDAVAIELKGKKVVDRNAVVLDLDEIGWPAGSLAEWLRSMADFYVRVGGPGNPAKAPALADQIEAQTKPPRMAEPGWGEQVMASVEHSSNKGRRPFVRAYTSQVVGSVWTDAQGFHAAWSDLIDPEPVQR